MQPQLVEVAGRAEQRPVPTVELCAYYAAEDQPGPVPLTSSAVASASSRATLAR